MYSLILIITTIVAFLTYSLFTTIKWPNLPSYSKSYYKMKYPTRMIFQGWVLSLSSLVYLIGNNYWYLSFSILLTLVAFFPTIKNEKHFIWHMLGAVISIIGLIIYQGLLIRDHIIITAALFVFSFLCSIYIEHICKSNKNVISDNFNHIKHLEFASFTVIICQMCKLYL